MQSHSAMISCFIMITFTPQGLSTPKEFTFYNKRHIKCYFLKLQIHFSQDLLLIGCDIIPQVMAICLHLIKHASLDFSIY